MRRAIQYCLTIAAVASLASNPVRAEDQGQETLERLYEEANNCSSMIALGQIVSETSELPPVLEADRDIFDAWLSELSTRYGRIMHAVGHAAGRSKSEIRSDWENNVRDFAKENQYQGREGVIKLFDKVKACGDELSIPEPGTK